MWCCSADKSLTSVLLKSGLLITRLVLRNLFCHLIPNSCSAISIPWLLQEDFLSMEVSLKHLGIENDFVSLECCSVVKQEGNFFSVCEIMMAFFQTIVEHSCTCTSNTILVSLWHYLPLTARELGLEIPFFFQVPEDAQRLPADHRCHHGRYWQIHMCSRQQLQHQRPCGSALCSGWAKHTHSKKVHTGSAQVKDEGIH